MHLHTKLRPLFFSWLLDIFEGFCVFDVARAACHGDRRRREDATARHRILNRFERATLISDHRKRERATAGAA